MLSQKLSRINFKMSDLAEYEQVKLNRKKPMDATPEAKSEDFNAKTPKTSLAGVMHTSNKSTPAGSVSLRSSTPEHST